MAERLRACPLCAEPIQPAAMICKHCGRDVPRATEPPKPRISLGQFLAALVGVFMVIGVIVGSSETSSTASAKAQEATIDCGTGCRVVPEDSLTPGSNTSSGDYSRMKLIDVMADTSIKKFEVSGYLTVYSPTTASLSLKRDDWAFLRVYFGDLPIDRKKQLIQRCQVGKTCGVTVRGTRTGDSSMTLDDVSIRSSSSSF
jgi:hypothetical protein